MKKRIICDTCSALKLAEFDDKLFDKRDLSIGHVILHPTIFAEIKKWHPDKKQKYERQISVLNKVRAATGLRLDKKNYDAQEIIVKATRDSLGLSVGKSDIDQLISAMHFDLDLITNDSPFADLAASLDIAVFEAEEFMVEAIKKGVLTHDEAVKAIAIWKRNDEKRPSRETMKLLNDVGINY